MATLDQDKKVRLSEKSLLKKRKRKEVNAKSMMEEQQATTGMHVLPMKKARFDA